MSDNIEIRIDNKVFEKALLKVASKCEDTKPLMKNIAGIMMDSVEENFAKEGRPDKWQKLAPSTIKQRIKKRKWPGMILQLSAAGLASSITSKYDDNSAVVGTNKLYAAIHQFGGDAGRGRKVKIPARPYLVLQNNDMVELKTVINEFIL